MNNSITINLNDPMLAVLRSMDLAEAADRARHDKAQAKPLAVQHCSTLEHGIVFFNDLNEQHHASRCRPGNIVLLDGFADHVDADDICAEIADDINLKRGVI